MRYVGVFLMTATVMVFFGGLLYSYGYSKGSASQRLQDADYLGCQRDSWTEAVDWRENDAEPR